MAALTDWLGNDIGGTTEAGVGYTGMNWGDLLKTMGLGTPAQSNGFTPLGGSPTTSNVNKNIPMNTSLMTPKPMPGMQQEGNDQKDMNDISQIIQLATSLFGGGIG
jgi:hypothetical protein